ncbi:MAG: S1 RNA-binding domain-containing protein [Cyanobacteria bacterium P01_E01_bin.42]
MSSKPTNSNPTQASFSMDDFAKAIEGETFSFQRGEVVLGTIVEHTSDGIYVDIGGKSSGFVPSDEAALDSTGDLSKVLPLNEEFEFLIVRGQDAEGQVLLSRRQLSIKQAWDDMLEVKEKGSSVQMRVTGVNRGGVTGQVNGLRSFIPRSHLMEKENLDTLVGQSLTVTCLEVDPERRKLVLSQRDAARSEAIKSVEPGTLAEGKVVSIQPYGVFVDIGGLTGLLHVKQVSDSPIHSLNTVFKIGQELKVIVADIDEDKNRLSFSTKMLESYPGEILEKMDAVMADAEERLETAKRKKAEREQEKKQEKKQSITQPPPPGAREDPLIQPPPPGAMAPPLVSPQREVPLEQPSQPPPPGATPPKELIDPLIQPPPPGAILEPPPANREEE